MMVKKMDHLGIAVRNLEEQIAIYRDVLGMELEGIEAIPGNQARVAFLSAGDTRVELLEPLSTEGPIAKHLAERGAGIHHVAFQVEDVRAAAEEARAGGLQPIGEGPGIGAHHTLVWFLHPKSTGGVLMELVQRR